MHDNHTTPGSPSPDVVELELVERILTKASEEMPLITLENCLTVSAEVLPNAVGRMHPICAFITGMGEHAIPTQFVWKDLETNEVYCHLVCAAKAAIVKAALAHA